VGVEGELDAVLRLVALVVEPAELLDRFGPDALTPGRWRASSSG
jgi:hypothetical protein